LSFVETISRKTAIEKSKGTWRELPPYSPKPRTAIQLVALWKSSKSAEKPLASSASIDDPSTTSANASEQVVNEVTPVATTPPEDSETTRSDHSDSLGSISPLPSLPSIALKSPTPWILEQDNEHLSVEPRISSETSLESASDIEMFMDKTSPLATSPAEPEDGSLSRDCNLDSPVVALCLVVSRNIAASSAHLSILIAASQRVNVQLLATHRT
jgi:hypothetical protein